MGVSVSNVVNLYKSETKEVSSKVCDSSVCDLLTGVSSKVCKILAC